MDARAELPANSRGPGGKAPAANVQVTPLRRVFAPPDRPDDALVEALFQLLTSRAEDLISAPARATDGVGPLISERHR
jgi:hypothetical protein